MICVEPAAIAIGCTTQNESQTWGFGPEDRHFANRRLWDAVVVLDAHLLDGIEHAGLNVSSLVYGTVCSRTELL